MKCEHCDKELTTEKVCPKCGTKVKPFDVEAVPKPKETLPELPEDEVPAIDDLGTPGSPIPTDEEMDRKKTIHDMIDVAKTQFDTLVKESEKSVLGTLT